MMALLFNKAGAPGTDRWAWGDSVDTVKTRAAPVKNLKQDDFMIFAFGNEIPISHETGHGKSCKFLQPV
jgi:hypothetical protein